MSHPQYTAQYLQTLSPAAVKTIAASLGLTPAFRKEAAIAQIINHQAGTLQAAQPEAKTCKDCPYFASRMDGSDKGWCHLFDVFARESHPETQDCVNQGGEVEGVTPIDTDADPNEWETAQEEILAVLEEQVRSIAPKQVESIEEGTATLTTGEVIYTAPEPVIKLSDNLYRVLSSEGTHRYAVNTRKRTCTCAAGSYSRNCRHLKQADEVEAEEFRAWQTAAAKVPAGWREKQVVHTTPAGTEVQTWYYNSKGHRTNKMPAFTK